jgi:hypothetical protein
MITGQAERVHEIPPPEAKEPGWYPDPLGSTAERYWDGTWLELIRVPKVKLVSRMPARSAKRQKWGRRGLRLPLALVGREAPAQPSDERAPGDARARSKAEQKRSTEVEARKQAFFESPAGRARLSFGQKQRLFQFELELEGREAVVIPGVEGTAPRSTSDTVDILNSVVSEGWKLVAGSFVYAEMRGGPVGFYLFKRSKKRHREMNDPWKGSAE